MEILTKSAKETKALGKKVVLDLTKKNRPLILALTGNLGSGKTTFVQGMAEGLGIKQRIISPTFILLRKYELKPTADSRRLIADFYHIDLYRLEEDIERELVNLGVEEIWSDPKNIIAIEWAEKAKSPIPKEAVWIKFETVDKNKRRIRINV
jgi:tRNA threonylcarbamoyladenosine biosynthesis protein TsaE